MNSEDVNAGNKLIAEFLRSKYINDAPSDHPDDYYYQPYDLENDCPTGLPADWCFDSSWDWLMPVLDKISELEIVGYWELTSDTFAIYSDDTYINIGKGIGKVYVTVIEFIKYYNKLQGRTNERFNRKIYIEA